jgi:hypothetical protein
LNNEYHNLANQLNNWEENNQGIYKFETDRLKKMANNIASTPAPVEREVTITKPVTAAP